MKTQKKFYYVNVEHIPVYDIEGTNEMNWKTVQKGTEKIYRVMLKKMDGPDQGIKSFRSIEDANNYVTKKMNGTAEKEEKILNKAIEKLNKKTLKLNILIKNLEQTKDDLNKKKYLLSQELEKVK